jgi:surface protein
MNTIKLNVIGESKTSEGSKINLETLSKTITKNGTYIFTPQENSAYNKADIIVDVSLSKEGVAMIDFSSIGYGKDAVRFMQDKSKEDIAYSKTLYDAWDVKNTSAAGLYQEKNKVIYAPNINTINVINMSYMFWNCYALTYIPPLNTSSVTNMDCMFRNCMALTTIPQLDTSNVTAMNQTFDGCSALTTIPQLDTTKVTSMYNAFSSCHNLVNLGGFVNCKVSLYIPSRRLTHESIMNVINNLYDLTANGLSGQTLTLHPDIITTLTNDEIAIATNKGWTIK